MLHLYCGDGKGKSTAACGLALRAAGSGMRVLFVQFFKDGSSSEMRILERLPELTLRYPARHYGRFRALTDDKREELRGLYRALFSEIEQSCAEYSMLVLDEAISAYRYGMFEQEKFLALLHRERRCRELVLTGRNPPPELLAEADYITEMKKLRHPFDAGILARKGIEY